MSTMPAAAPSASSAADRPGGFVVPTIATGILLGCVYTLSPMTIWFAVATAVAVWLSGRGLPPREQRWVRGLLAAAIAVRVLLIAALFLLGTPDYMWFNVFFGDEQYLIVRSLRLRQLWLGAPLSPEAFLDVFEAYGQTSYLNVIAYAQLLCGPAPYGVHLLNVAFYAAGAIILHRVVRTAFGRMAATASLAGLLFFPTLLLWSASALKESLNFLIATCVIAATVAMVRARWTYRPLSALGALAGLAALQTFRAGASEIIGAGLAIGLAARFLSHRLWRFALVLIVLCAVAVPVARSARVHEAALRLLRPSARMHMGHVFTRGHSYKLLDQHFYERRGDLTMTWPELGRYVARGIGSVLLFPRPWDAQTRLELAYIPEQMAWYVILVTALIGVVSGIRRDVFVTFVFGACSMTALLAVGLNSGNMGTLVRHRALALPYLIVLSTVGLTALVARVSGVSTVTRS